MHFMITELEVKYYLFQIVNALKYLKNNKIIHRNLKLQNILISDKMNVKLSDFHLAAKLDSDKEIRSLRIGSPNYMAPEIIDITDNGYSYEVDIWALGVIIYFLTIGKTPFGSKTIEETYQNIKLGKYFFPEDSEISENAKDLIQKLLLLDPNKRLKLDEILNHNFLKLNINIPRTLPEYTLKKPPKIEFIKEYDQDNKNNNGKKNIMDNNNLCLKSINENNEKTKEDLEKEIKELKFKLSKEEKDCDSFRVRIKELENELNEEKEKYINEKDKLNESEEKIKELNNLLSNNSNISNNKIIELMNKIIEKDEEIKELKSLLPFEMKKGEKLMTVIFRSMNQEILYSVICKNTDKFTKIENLLYEEYPKYRERNNIFIFNGKMINKYLNLDENGIINNSVLILNTLNE